MVEVMYGPMQLLVVGFSDPDFHGQTRRALGSVMEKGIVRLIDLQFVYMDADGNVSTIEATQLDEDERMRFGAAIGALIDLGAGGVAGARRGAEAGVVRAAERDYGIDESVIRDEVIEAIPNDSAAAFLLIEHLWARDFKQSLRDAGGSLVVQGMLEPETLVAAGAALRKMVESADAEERKRVAAPAR